MRVWQQQEVQVLLLQAMTAQQLTAIRERAEKATAGPMNRAERIRLHPCPKCKAKVGEPCRTAPGFTYLKLHSCFHQARKLLDSSVNPS